MEFIRTRKKLPSLQSSILTARNFYFKKNAMQLYQHCLEVMKKAEEVKMVNGSAIKHYKKDPERAELNHRITEIVLYHMIDYDKVKCLDPSILQMLEERAIVDELRIFCQLRNLDRAGAPLESYIPLLNDNKPAPLALLPRIVDVAVTHTTSQRTNDVINNNGCSIFRLYDSQSDAENSLKRDATAGEKIYAPLAEFFGYPSLAGDILLHAFKINHREIYEYVMEKMNETGLTERLHTTQNIVKDLARRIRQTLRVQGFTDAIVAPRMKKHEGKIMRKIYRRLVDEFKRLHVGHNESSEENEEKLNKYIRSIIQYYDIAKLNDLVALRVIINKLHGIEVDKMEEDAKGRALELAKAVIESNLCGLNTTPGVLYKKCTPEFKVKPENGYKAFHYDTEPEDVLTSRLLRFEVQLKTKEWHQIAEEGGAAHHYYLGGNQTLVDSLFQSYKSIIHMVRNKDRKTKTEKMGS
ncbi:MAG: hypothetical protein QW590_02265 [Candidatus Bilamarchaeaceae archaeon]